MSQERTRQYSDIKHHRIIMPDVILLKKGVRVRPDYSGEGDLSFGAAERVQKARL